MSLVIALQRILYLPSIRIGIQIDELLQTALRDVC